MAIEDDRTAYRETIEKRGLRIRPTELDASVGSDLMVVREVEIGHPLHTIIEKRYWLNLPQIGFTHRLISTTIETRGLLPHQQFMCKTPLHLRHHLTKVVHGRRLRTTPRLALALPLHHTLTHRGVRMVLRRLGARLQVL